MTRSASIKMKKLATRSPAMRLVCGCSSWFTWLSSLGFGSTAGVHAEFEEVVVCSLGTDNSLPTRSVERGTELDALLIVTGTRLGLTGDGDRGRGTVADADVANIGCGIELDNDASVVGVAEATDVTDVCCAIDVDSGIVAVSVFRSVETMVEVTVGVAMQTREYRGFKTSIPNLTIRRVWTTIDQGTRINGTTALECIEIAYVEDRT